jgi:broad specificity phosphatase PhoE
MIKFIKMLKYDLRNQGEDLDFDWVSRVTLQQEDPKSLYPGGLESIKEAEVIYHSPLRRVVECLPYNHNAQEFYPLESLREIKFDLRQFCTKNELFKYGSKIVRQQFKDFFTQDILITSRTQIFEEVKEILKRCVESHSSKIVVVSHSFRLSIIEAFINTEAKIETEPHLIHKFIFDDTKRFDFGDGFTVDRLKILQVLSKL